MNRVTQDLNNELLVEFLEDKQTVFLEDWYKNIIIADLDTNKEKMIENGLRMYTLTKFVIKDSFSKDELKEFAYSVAKERLDSNTNIGDFVYNVNLGRSIIMKHVSQSDNLFKVLPNSIDNINQLFDHFIFHAVSRYTYLKDKELQEKTVFINENHKDKLAILGQMSSSFVHEFRNPLTSIIGFTKILKNEHPELPYLDIIEMELNQLKFRITQFLHTSKVEINEDYREDILLANLLDDIYQLSYPSIVDTDVIVDTDIDNELAISANRDEIKQVLLNIVINSLDALRYKATKPRMLTISCFKEDSNLVVDISNNGPAIPTELVETIFDPFFTTKELGTGIGLFVCKKIIEKHGGTITCTSSETLTSFTIHLPL